MADDVCLLAQPLCGRFPTVALFVGETEENTTIVVLQCLTMAVVLDVVGSFCCFLGRQITKAVGMSIEKIVVLIDTAYHLVVRA